MAMQSRCVREFLLRFCCCCLVCCLIRAFCSTIISHSHTHTPRLRCLTALHTQQTLHMKLFESKNNVKSGAHSRANKICFAFAQLNARRGSDLSRRVVFFSCSAELGWGEAKSNTRNSVGYNSPVQVDVRRE